MPYWECVTRSFRIAWGHKYLWLLALFSGEAGGASANYSQNTGPRSTTGGSTNVNGTIDYQAFQNAVTTWITDHLALIIAIAVVWLLLVVAFFILAAVCEGGLVRASAEHDAERPFGLRWAWRSGVNTMWVIVRFRLLFVLFGLPVFLIIVAFTVGTLVAVVNHNGSATGALVGLGLLLLLVSIPYLIYLSLLEKLGARALVLEQLMAWPAVVRAHRLLFKRLGRALLVWLLAVGVALVIGLAFACVLAIVFLPLALIGVGIAMASSGNSAAIVLLAIVGILVFLPISLLIQSFLGAQGSTYWTLAFRRLDIDYPPAPVYAYPPAPIPPAPPAQPAP